MTPSNIWLTRGLTERLIELHVLRGSVTMSMREISEKLSHEFKLEISRNAVIGRAARMGLGAHPAKPAKFKEKASPKYRPRPRPAASWGPANPLTINQLGNGDCKWVLGEIEARPPYLYCGKETGIGRSWCPEHYGVVYVRPRVSWE